MLLIGGGHVSKQDIDEFSSNAFITRGFYVAPEILEELRTWTNNPLSLKHITRQCIRKTLGYNTEENIDKLPMAKPLKTYLNLVELDYISVERTSDRHPLFSASNFIRVTPCGHAVLHGSMLANSITPTLGRCRCNICRQYAETMSVT